MVVLRFAIVLGCSKYGLSKVLLEMLEISASDLISRTPTEQLQLTTQMGLPGGLFVRTVTKLIERLRKLSLVAHQHDAWVERVLPNRHSVNILETNMLKPTI
jgi:hypothetical protein